MHNYFVLVCQEVYVIGLVCLFVLVSRIMQKVMTEFG